ncbi:zinc transporter ZIP10-like [Dendronephthya gigantea]|uniref:zinc transporter ZIP10-like n=1 Tax=Dendronephthya gigantea TaxID=151771 RepID=UPI00106974CC|nr:zinc transporter ZIP10-like [Dendronephthya gigantea]
MYQKCFTVDEFFYIYQIKNKTEGFDKTKFQSVSSALLQQIESDVCIKAGHPHDEKDVADKHKWGYGMLAVAIISFCSILGVAIIPFMEKIFYQKAVMFLISLAVGTLVGDALLHLFPHALGFHANHDHSHGSESTGESEDRDYLWKFLVATAAIYVFFIFETITHLFLRKSIGQSHSMEHTRRHKQINSHDHDHNVTEVAAVESGYSHKNPGVASMNMGYVNSGGPDEFGKSQNVKDENVPKTSEIREEGEVKKTISAVAWNIIIGDTIHNVADGIAIGVAFSDSIAGGISTSIAVFCHELPHELGDFAVLLTAGMSVKKALLANFISACFCFVGLVMGILISDVSEDINLWIFAATGGFFIYIALTNMLPELMHSAEFNAVSCFSRFLFQNLGILTGFAIMFLLSYFEEDINIE